MKFLKLHYTEGVPFLINTAVIAGIEVNGTPDKGCVVTLNYQNPDGEQAAEQVTETFDEIEQMLMTAAS